MPLLLICVNAALLAALVLLAVWVERLRSRGRRTARDVTDLSRAVATVQSWAAQEMRALRNEFTVARVDTSAASVLERLEKARAASSAPPPEPDHDKERRDRAALSERAALALASEEDVTKRERNTALPATPGDVAAYSKLVTASVAVDEEAGSEEKTRVWSKSALAAALTETEAGGAHRSPQATPRASLAVAVAPPTSASSLPPSEAARVRPAGAGRCFTPTVVSMQALPTPTSSRAASPALPPELNDEPRDTVAMPAPASMVPASPAPNPSNDDGEETTCLELAPPMYARREQLLRPPAPHAHSDVIRCEDAAEETLRAH